MAQAIHIRLNFVHDWRIICFNFLEESLRGSVCFMQVTSEVKTSWIIFMGILRFVSVKFHSVEYFADYCPGQKYTRILDIRHLP